MPATAGVLTDHGGAAATAHAEGGEVAARPWHALWTHSHCEHLVHHQLAAKGFELFLPEIDVWTRRGSPATSKLRRSLAVEVDCMLVAAA